MVLACLGFPDVPKSVKIENSAACAVAAGSSSGGGGGGCSSSSSSSIICSCGGLADMKKPLASRPKNCNKH